MATNTVKHNQINASIIYSAKQPFPITFPTPYINWQRSDEHLPKERRCAPICCNGGHAFDVSDAFGEIAASIDRPYSVVCDRDALDLEKGIPIEI
jgi:hypothetical protein